MTFQDFKSVPPILFNIFFGFLFKSSPLYYLPCSGNLHFLSQKKFLLIIDQLIIGNKGKAINQKFRPWIDKVNLDQWKHDEREWLRVVPFNWPPRTPLQPPCPAVFFILFDWFSIKALGFMWVKSETTLPPQMVVGINARHGCEGVLPEICWVLAKIFVWNLFVSWENKGESVWSYLVFMHVREKMRKNRGKEKKTGISL